MQRQLNLVLSKPVTLGLFALMVAVPISRGQAPGPPSAGVQKLAAVAKQLNLTPEQKMKLLPILEAEAPKLKAIKANTSMPPLQKLDQLRAIHQQVDPQVQSILTPAQYEQWQEIRRQEVLQVLQERAAAQQQ